ncbi:hypothetical protein [Paraburkholderia fungorum]|uniref:hypothetical protein n=1 Tax=Paraburkholderia fungorum TaxID=134537 RepID=UPI003D6B168D
MVAPLLFTAHNGVVLFCLRPVPDWIVQEAKQAINREGLEVPVDSRAFDVWREAYEQLRDAVFHVNNQRRITAPEPPRAA